MHDVKGTKPVRPVLPRLTALFQRLKTRKIRRLVLSSSLFDSDYYLEHNPDVARAGIDPLDHFLSPRGLSQNPHPLFDSSWYLDLNPDVSEAGVNPLVHYLHYGWKERRRPHPLFDSEFYLAQDIEAAEKKVEPLSEYLRKGSLAGYDPHPLFETKFYLAQIADLPSSVNPLIHYVTRGWREQLNPHPLFDVAFYLDRNTDVKEAGVEPLQQYLLWGWKDGRDPHPLFDPDWYWAQKADTKGEQNQNPLLHYVTVGWKEKRSPCAMFDEAFYLSQHPNVATSGTCSLRHYILYGVAEGSNPNRWFDTQWYVSQNPEVLRSGRNPLAHYAETGMREGKRTRPLSKRGSLAGARSGAQHRVIFVSGEPHSAGHRYRVVHLADSLPRQLFETSIAQVSDVPRLLGDITEADLVWVWRARLCPETELLLAAHRQRGFTLLYDLDDLMFRPELAIVSVIDGIRSQKMLEKDVGGLYRDIHRFLMEADRCTAPTVHLAQEIRELGKPATVIPNGFDRRMFERARRAARARKATPDDGKIRIGYAAGSLTHQRDLALASCAISAILKENPRTRLVLFRGTVILDEFPELEAVQDQIEWREIVPFDELPAEYARFDINIAPLEPANRFCKSKSELKFFEAALVGVPTVASPTGAYATAIRHGENGLLAHNNHDWYEQLNSLLADASLRARIAGAAYQNVLWHYGPERRSVLTTRLVNQVLAPIPIRYELFRPEMQADSGAALPPIALPEYDVIFQSSRNGASRVSVIVPLYNYRHYVEEALDSILQQTLHNIDVIVVDDRSTDDSAEVAHRWLKRYASRFHMVALLQNRCNSKLGRTRNVGVSFSDTELYMALDADNALLPDCLELCLRKLDETGAAFAYPTITIFGENHEQLGLVEYDPAHFQCSNYIDAMAMVRKACWVAVGGYTPLEPVGWEDYEFWCKLAEKGLFGVRVPETTARYRSHAASMLRTVTDLPEIRPRAIEEMNRRHPWLQLRPERHDDSSGASFSSIDSRVAQATDRKLDS
ncbi:MAG: glycosyltransferase [Acidobacteriaceae bacterium]|nr:glycosyltransferase [Acidobacteriaceae bacterium]MBV9766860.1 glycosyltransferase [Acidobacteriaceae bacterium]